MQKISLILVYLILINIPAAYADWEEQIDQNKQLMSKEAYHLIWQQYKAFQAGKLPKITNHTLTSIELKESDEKFIDVNKGSNERIKISPTLKRLPSSPEYNAWYKETSKVRSELYKKLEKLVEELDKIAPAFGFKKGQVTILVFEELGSFQAQEYLFNNKVAEIQKENPHFTSEQSISEASKWISPVKNNASVHSTEKRGVDICLFDNTSNKFINMGKFGVIGVSNPYVPTFSNYISDEEIKNRLFLLIAASSANLVNHLNKFYHFSEGDSYASYWLQSQSPAIQIKNLVTQNEIAKSFDAFLELRPLLPNAKSFVNQVIDQQKAGYKIVAITQGDEIIACIGFRIMRMLASGKILYVDDLITKEKWRGRGYGKILLEHVTKIARDEGCEQIHLDSGYTRHAAHKVYLKYGFELNAHHFVLKLK